jgi:7-cyano-7-deazaguanine synthase
MCSVVGVLCRFNTLETAGNLSILIERSAQRGRDSFGMVRIFPDGASTRLTQPSEVFRMKASGPWTALANLRGEPAPEWVQDKTPEDVQPFRSPSGRWIFTHNGTIANDKEILGEGFDSEHECPDPTCALKPPPTQIDSYAIGVAFDRFGFVETVMNELVGSFALLAVDIESPEVMHYAANYKPLFVMGSKDGSQVLFGSQRSYFDGLYSPLEDPGPVELGPYEYGFVTSRTIERNSLYPKKEYPSPKRTLVVCSGGLDSSVAAWHQFTQGDDVTLLHFVMGAKAQDPEITSVMNLAQRMYGEEAENHWMSIDTSFFKVHTPSVLTDETKEVNKRGSSGAELATEWVPARNTVFAGLAMAVAESQGFDRIVFGVNLEEGGAFPDNEPEWANKIRALLPYAVKAYMKVELLTPVGNLMKHEIVRMGIEEGAPLELTWSCYEGGDHHCGKCGPCFNRRTAFEMNGTVDPAFLDVINGRATKEVAEGEEIASQP